MRRFAFALAFVAGGLAAGPARATPEFPGAIVGDLNIKCDGGASPIWDGMGCTICHTSNGGGLGTVQHPFGAALKMEGLSAFADGELSTLLDNEKTAMHDFNCDGIPDIEELESCQWEQLAMTSTVCNGGDGGAADAGPPIDNVIYGCDASPRSSRASTIPAALAALLASVLLVTRLRAKRRLKGDR